MRTRWLVLAGLTLAASAFGQRAPIQATPLPSLPRLPQGGLPVQQAPGAPNAQGQAAPPGSAPPGIADRSPTWLPAGGVRLQALDKVNAQTNALTIKVGQSVTFGSLTISAKACLVRPADQPADAAAYLAVVDSHPDSAGFNGWMLANEPSVSMMEHPIYDLRVTGCS